MTITKSMEAEVQRMADDSVSPMHTVPTSDRSSLSQQGLIGQLWGGFSLPGDLGMFGVSDSFGKFLSSLDKYEASQLIDDLGARRYELVRSAVLEKGYTL